MRKGEKQSCICMDRAEGEQVTPLHPPLFHDRRLFVITSIIAHNSMLLCVSEMLGLDLFYRKILSTLLVLQNKNCLRLKLFDLTAMGKYTNTACYENIIMNIIIICEKGSGIQEKYLHFSLSQQCVIRQLCPSKSIKKKSNRMIAFEWFLM